MAPGVRGDARRPPHSRKEAVTVTARTSPNAGPLRTTGRCRLLRSEIQGNGENLGNRLAPWRHIPTVGALRPAIRRFRALTCLMAVLAVLASRKPVEPPQGPSACLLHGAAEALSAGLSSGRRMTLP